MKLTWYDGGLTPPKPEEIGDEKLNGEGGIIYIGSKGKMMQDTYGSTRGCCRSRCTTPTARRSRSSRASRTRQHEMNWVEAIKGKAGDLVARSSTPRS